MLVYWRIYASLGLNELRMGNLNASHNNNEPTIKSCTHNNSTCVYLVGSVKSIAIQNSWFICFDWSPLIRNTWNNSNNILPVGMMVIQHQREITKIFAGWHINRANKQSMVCHRGWSRYDITIRTYVPKIDMVLFEAYITYRVLTTNHRFNAFLPELRLRFTIYDSANLCYLIECNLSIS